MSIPDLNSSSNLYKKIIFSVEPRSYRYVLVLFFKLTNITELAVGGSATDQVLGSGVTDNPVIKMPTLVYYSNNNNRVEEIVPYIPGSTIKGLLRSIAEKHVAMMDKNNKRKLIDVLMKLIELDEQSKTGYLDKHDVSEIVDKILAKILNQYLDEKIVNKICNSIREYNNFKEFIKLVKKASETSWSSDLGKALEEIVSDEEINELMNNIAPIIITILNNYEISPDVCNPVIEGLMCELPIPKYKLLLLNALSETINKNITYPCRICKLFGLPGYMSRLIVTDAWPLGVKKTILLLRTHIAIDRLRESVVSGKTFDIEYIAPGAEFGFIIIYHLATQKDIEKIDQNNDGTLDKLIETIKKASNKTDEENLDLLKKIIENIETNGVWIGKRKTWGMGKVEIKLEATALIDLSKQTDPSHNPLILGKNPNEIISQYIKQGIPLPLKNTLQIFFPTT